MQMIYMESISNPTLRLFDIPETSSKAHSINKDIVIAIDNTFLTPILHNGFKLGADLVFYSTTKYINGHADFIGGMVATNCSKIHEKIRRIQEGWKIPQ